MRLSHADGALVDDPFGLDGGREAGEAEGR